MKILLATDGSAHALEAAKALQNFHRNDLDVYVVTVSYNPEKTASVFHSWIPEWNAKETERVEKHHKEVKGLLPDYCRAVHLIRREGNPSHQILEEAQQIDADLIVLGSQGHSQIGRVLLGSVSDNVATHAKCSVLVVRPKAEESSSSHRFHKIALAYDGSPGSREAITEWGEQNWDQDTDVRIVGVAPQLPFYSDSCPQALQDYLDKETQQVREAGERIASKIALNYHQPQSVTLTGDHVGDSLVGMVEENHCDLIVLGDTGHSLLTQWIMGSTSKHVLRHTSSSVWISRYHRTNKTADGLEGQC